MTAIQQCDELYANGDMQRALEAILAAPEQNEPEVVWRVVRMKFKVIELKGQKAVEAFIDEGLSVLRENLQKTPDCPNTNKWIAILLGTREKHSSFKSQIEEAFLIRDHLAIAIKNNPEDGYAEYILGKWCYQVASVSWYQKKVAATLFASPPESTYEEALTHLERAQQLKPDIFNACHLLAAKCLIELSKKAEAGPYLKKCVDLENFDDAAKKNAVEARKLAKSIGVTV